MHLSDPRDLLKCDTLSRDEVDKTFPIFPRRNKELRPVRDFSPSMLLYGALSLFRTKIPRYQALLSFVTSSLTSPIALTLDFLHETQQPYHCPLTGRPTWTMTSTRFSQKSLVRCSLNPCREEEKSIHWLRSTQYVKHCNAQNNSLAQSTMYYSFRSFLSLLQVIAQFDNTPFLSSTQSFLILVTMTNIIQSLIMVPEKRKTAQNCLFGSSREQSRCWSGEV